MRTGRRPAEDELERQLRDLLCLAVVGDHLRWVVTGDGDGALADWLTDASADWRDWADLVARELRSYGVAPDGRVRSLAEDISLNWVPDGWLAADAARRLLVERLLTVADCARYRRAQTSGERGAVLDVICSGLDAQLQALRGLSVPVSAAR
jgi:hypothetical protein